MIMRDSCSATAASRSAPTTLSSGPDSRRDQAMRQASFAVASGSVIIVRSSRRGFDSVPSVRVEIVIQTGVPSAVITRHASRTTTGSPRNGAEVESSGIVPASRRKRTMVALESRGGRSSRLEMPIGFATPESSASDQTGTPGRVGVVTVAVRWRAHSRVAGPAASNAGCSCGSCENSSTVRGTAVNESRAKTTGAPRSTDITATTPPSESSHAVMAGADCDAVPPLTTRVATSGCADLIAGTSLFPQASADSNTRAGARAGAKRRGAREWKTEAMCECIIDAVEAKVPQDPNAMRRDARHRVDHAAV